MDWFARVLGAIGAVGSLVALTLHYLRHRRGSREAAVRSKTLAEEAVDLVGDAEGSTTVSGRAALAPDDRKRLELARRKLDKALSLNPKNADALNALAMLFNQTGRLEEALQAIEQAKKAGGKALAYYGTAGVTHTLLGNHHTAQELLREGLGKYPGSALLNANLGFSLLDEGRLSEAVAQYKVAAEQEPTNWTHQLNLGSALIDAGQLDEAAYHCLRAVRLKPDCAEAHQNLGVLLGQMGNAKQALAHFQEATRLNPWLAYAHCNVGQTLVQLINDKEIPAEPMNVKAALAAFQTAIDRHPGLAKAYSVRGLLFARLENGEVQAERDLTEAIRLDPTDSETYEILAELLDKTSRGEEAAQVRREAADAGVDIRTEPRWLAWSPDGHDEDKPSEQD